MWKVIAGILAISIIRLVAFAGPEDFYEKQKAEYSSRIDKANKKLEKVKRNREKEVMNATKDYIKALEKVKVYWTKKGELKEALKYQNQIDELQKMVGAAIPDQKPAKNPENDDDDGAMKEGEGIEAKLFASSSVGADVYVNGDMVIENAYREVAGAATTRIKEGDVIAVRCSHRFDIASFWLNALTPDGRFLFSTSRKWYGYIPDDPEKWWVPPKKMSRKKRAIEVKDTREYTDLVKKVAKSIPDSVPSQPIASKVSPEDNTGGYIFYVIRDYDLEPRKKSRR